MPKRGASSQRDAAVALVRAAGDERVQRRAEAEQRGDGRDVVDDAVGDHDDAGEPVRRHVGEAVRQRREQARAVVVLGVAARRRSAARRRAVAPRRRCSSARTVSVMRGAVAERLRGRAVDRRRRRRPSPSRAPPGSATGSRAPRRRAPAPRARTSATGPRDSAATRTSAATAAASAPQGPGGEERREAEASAMDHPHCPSRSSSAGTCTWSAL